MSIQNADPCCGVVELDEQQGWELFDRTARACMGVTATEFIEAWRAGKFDDVDWDDIPGLAEVAIALPFAVD